MPFAFVRCTQKKPPFERRWHGGDVTEDCSPGCRSIPSPQSKDPGDNPHPPPAGAPFQRGLFPLTSSNLASSAIVPRSLPLFFVHLLLSPVLRPSSFVLRPSSFVLRLSSFVFRPSSFVPRPSSFVSSSLVLSSPVFRPTQKIQLRTQRKWFAVEGEGKARPAHEKALRLFHRLRAFPELVGEGGFEPPKSVTTDLQSAPFDRSGIPPDIMMNLWSWWTDSNPRPADYKSAALPTELHQQFQQQCLF